MLSCRNGDAASLSPGHEVPWASLTRKAPSHLRDPRSIQRPKSQSPHYKAHSLASKHKHTTPAHFPALRLTVPQVLPGEQRHATAPCPCTMLSLSKAPHGPALAARFCHSPRWDQEVNTAHKHQLDSACHPEPVTPDWTWRHISCLTCACLIVNVWVLPATKLSFWQY